MQRPDAPDEAFDLTIRYPALFASFIEKTLLARTLLAIDTHHFEVIGNGKIFVRGRGIAMRSNLHRIDFLWELVRLGHGGRGLNSKLSLQDLFRLGRDRYPLTLQRLAEMRSTRDEAFCNTELTGSCKLVLCKTLKVSGESI